MSSSSESEEELGIIATRERRANAGSRLKQLLQQEELDIGTQGFEQDDDDENVNLLFQEDENDDEFVEDYGEEEEEEDEDEEDEEDQGNVSPKKAASEEPNDEMFSSESEISASDSDESEGERELRREEKLKRKKRAEKAKFIPPVINKSTPIRTKPKTKVTADSFMNSSSRASTRKSAVENKLAIVERLKEEEERRSKLKPVIRKEVVALTQRERLAEAKTTERTNVLSLNKFHEQEQERKEKQKQMMLNRRKKLQNVLRFYSASALVYPIDELEDLEKVKKIEAEFMKSHKKRVYKKRKKKTEVTKDETTDTPKGEIKVESSENAKDEKKDDNALKEANGLDSKVTDKQGEDPLTKDDEKQDEAISLAVEESPDKNGIPTEIDTVENRDIVMEDAPNFTEVVESTASPVLSSKENTENTENENAQLKEASEPTVDIKIEVEAPTEPSQKAKKVSFNEESSQLEFSTESPVASLINNNIKETEVKADVNQTSIKPESETEIESETEPHTQSDGNHEEEEGIDSKEKEVQYEGPPQFVARNMIELLEFSKKLTKLEYTKYILGDQAVLPAQRRTSHLKPLIRIKQQPTMIETLFIPYSSTHEKEFHEILTLPKFGEENKTVHKQLLVKESDTKKIEIITPAPIGIYLPNGSKKICPISGKPASYFDPKNGVPYASVEAYRVLKDVQDEQFAWIQPDKGGEYSRYKGGIGAYLQRWDVRHAKNVPDWF
ncbi:BA75_00167T0 [Komagataella pastoris]|uniref:BA75_00167T0 n=1 Tax=Komagataella pastoris TaxID=4922 RepID=A0A1B2J7D3_PICPA|nr:BA75_00167T0 [Komagataella pastoris]